MTFLFTFVCLWVVLNTEITSNHRGVHNVFYVEGLVSPAYYNAAFCDFAQLLPWPCLFLDKKILISGTFC